MSAILKRLPSTKQLPKITNPEPTTYHLLETDQDHLTLAIKEKFKNADDLIIEIEKLLSQGTLPDDFLVELIALFDSEKDFKRLKDKINQIYTKIINIYVDALIAINQDAINAVNLSELCSPKKSKSLNKRVNELSDNLEVFITRKILGFDSLRKTEFRSNLITENERLKRRTLRIHMWIDIAKRSFEKRNDMAGMIIMMALDNRALGRLTKSTHNLNNVAQVKLQELLDFKRTYFTSKGAAEYFKNIVTRTPIIPYPFGILKYIFQVAENEKDQTDNKSLWHKIDQLEYMGDLKVLLLKEQHDVFALSLPIWEFVASKSVDVIHTYEIKGLTAQIYINCLDIDNAYIISTLIETKDTAESSSKQLPNDIMLYDPNKKESAQQTSNEDLILFKKWLRNNYLNKLKSLHELLPTLSSLNKALKESQKEYSFADLEKHFDIKEGLIVTIFQVLHSANTLKCLNDKFAEQLDIDKSLLNETMQLILDSQLSLSEIRKFYFEIHQRHMIGQEDNVEHASIKADLADLNQACKSWAIEIEDYIKSGTFYGLKQIKLTFKKLILAHIKYQKYVNETNQAKNELGKKNIKIINDDYADMKIRLESIETLLTQKELKYINSPAILEELIHDWNIRFLKLSKNYETCIAQAAQLKTAKEGLNELIIALEDLIIEFPLLMDRKDYKDKDHLHKQITHLKQEIIKLIQLTETALNNIKQQKQKNKSSPLLNTSETEQNINRLNKKYAIEQKSLALLPKAKLQNEMNQLICRRLDIPTQYKIGKLVANQRSLFYALAKSLNSLHGYNHFDEQTLRLICFDFYLNNRERVIKWQHDAKPVELDTDPYLKIRYTPQNMCEFFNKDAIAGKHTQDGRILCEALKLDAIYVIELNSKPRNNALTARYFMITQQNINIVKSINYQECIANKIPLILLNQEGCYLPLQLITQPVNSSPLPIKPNPGQQPLPDTSISKRVKITNEDMVKQLISIIVPKDYSLEAALSEGDCFFDAAALALSSLTQENITVKSLRLMCAEAAFKKNEAYPWLKPALLKDEKSEAGYANYLARISFTCEEMTEHEKRKTLTGTATWGRPDIEGRIFAAEFNIELHIIEVLEHPVNGIQVIENIINKHGSRQIEKMSPADYSRSNIIHLLNHRLHFVPLLYKPLRQELTGETTTRSVDKLIPPRP